MRMSVGLTGSLEQRWEQLEEAYCHVAQRPVTAMPQYKAVQVGLSAAAGPRELKLKAFYPSVCAREHVWGHTCSGLLRLRRSGLPCVFVPCCAMLCR